MKPTVVFTLGTEFSGTTAFGNILNNVFPGLYVGETRRLFTDDIYSIEAKSACLICAEQNKVCHLYGHLSEKVSDKKSPAQYLLDLSSKNGLSVVIDGSKEPDYLLAEINELREIADVRVVITIRNPIRNVSSMLDLIPDTGRWHEAFQRWRDAYWNILRTINRLSIPNLIVNTEIFNKAENPNQEIIQTIEKILRFVNLEAVIPNNILISTKPTHQIAGNPGTQGGRQKKIENEMRMHLNRELLFQLASDCPGFMSLANLLGIQSDQSLLSCNHDQMLIDLLQTLRT